MVNKILFKRSVDFKRTLTKIQLVIMAGVMDLWDFKGRMPVITSAQDFARTRVRGSKHYTGEALDFRTYYLKDQEKQEFLKQAISAFGEDYDVVLEADHLHIEYDPKDSESDHCEE